MRYEYLDPESFELTLRGHGITLLASIYRINHSKYPAVIERMRAERSFQTGTITFSDAPNFLNERGGRWDVVDLTDHGCQLKFPIELSDLEHRIAQKLLPAYLRKHGVLPDADLLENLLENEPVH